MDKIWKLKDIDLSQQTALVQSLNIHPIIARLLIAREIIESKEAASFLQSDLSKLHDPFQFKNMDRVVKRIREAKERGERVLVFGDYDVDGVTSSAILNSVLTQMGLDVIHHIPHRMTEGYGLNHEVADVAHQKGVKLLISIDCGITAFEEIETINGFGIDVIVIDHHEPSSKGVPNAYAIINPKQKDCPYPFKELASVGLAAKVSHALLGSLNQDILDLVAIGTIADVVPLRGENRIFVKEGLGRINQTKNKGLFALLETAKIKDKKMSPYYIGFILGPRINATGRMDSAHKSLDLFLSQDWQEAYALAQVLEQHNSDRQKMQRDVIEEALLIVEKEGDLENQKIIVLSKEGWHKGVLGIVASRLTDKYYRPSIVISVKDGVGTASARSIDGFHIHDALQDCAHCLENFGGHEGAAGLTIKAENIDPFRELINKIASERLEIKKLAPILLIDGEISFSQIDLSLIEAVNALEPFGEGNPSPIFCTTNLEVRGPAKVLGKDTLKFWVTDGGGVFSAVGFGMGKDILLVNSGKKIDLAYELIVDDWNKAPTPQLKIKDIRLSDVA
jgi:single-stranded-DNA-specific exonuclease